MLSDCSKLTSLGSRLTEARLLRNESQKMFAARIGVSVPTLRKMESGDPGVAIGCWATALDILDSLKDLDSLLPTVEDLFLKYDRLNLPKRKRAKRNTTQVEANLKNLVDHGG